MRALITIPFLVVALAAPAAADDNVPRVGVVIGFAFDVDAKVADALGASLADALAGKLEVDAIGGGEVTRRLPTGGLPDECVSTPACIADVARRLGADQLLFLGVVHAGTDYQIDATFVDVASGNQVARPRIKIGDPAKAPGAFAEQAGRYLPDAKVRGSNGNTVIVQGERHRPIEPAVWILGGVGVAGLVTASALGISVMSKHNQCDSPPYCTDAEQKQNVRRGHYADVALGVGVAAAVTAVILYVKTPVETLPVTPTVTPVEGGVVLAFDGRF